MHKLQQALRVHPPILLAPRPGRNWRTLISEPPRCASHALVGQLLHLILEVFGWDVDYLPLSGQAAMAAMAHSRRSGAMARWAVLMVAVPCFVQWRPTLRRPAVLRRSGYGYDPLTWALDLTVPEDQTKKVGPRAQRPAFLLPAVCWFVGSVWLCLNGSLLNRSYFFQRQMYELDARL